MIAELGGSIQIDTFPLNFVLELNISFRKKT